MSRLRYGHKFVLISVLILIPFLLLLWLWVTALQQEIDRARSESQGVAYMEALLPFMLEIQQHRGLANGYLNGDAAGEAAMTELEARMDKTARHAAEMDAAYGGAWQTGERWAAMASAWEALRIETRSLTAAESFARHSELIAALIDHMVFVSDQSGLTLDTELDSYYMMDLSVHHIPALIELVGQTRGKLNGLLAGNQWTENDRMALMLARSEMERGLAGIEKALSVTFQYNGSLEERVGEPGQAAVASVRGYLDSVNRHFIEGDMSGVEAKAFFAEGTRTIADADALFDTALSELNRLLGERMEELTQSRNMMIAAFVAALLLVTLFYLGFYYNTISAIRTLQAQSARMAGGDLTVQVELNTKDELRLVGDAFNQMSDALSRLLLNNQHISEQVAESSRQLSHVAADSAVIMQDIAQSVGGIAEVAEGQLKTSDDNTHALTEMAEAVNRIASTASEVADFSNNARAGADSGADKLREAVDQMEKIRQAAQVSRSSLLTLGERSQRIGEISSVIMEISAQTQLLSLNANIEAARAGEFGRGFMVVAGEVAKLAEQTRQAVQTIAVVVDEIRTLVAESNQSVASTSAEAEQGLTTIAAANEAIGSIRAVMNEMSSQMQEVSAAAEQLSAGTQQVTAAFTDTSEQTRRTTRETVTMAAASEEQLASIQEVQASAETLSSLAQRLQQELGKFKLADNAGGEGGSMA